MAMVATNSEAATTLLGESSILSVEEASTPAAGPVVKVEEAMMKSLVVAKTKLLAAVVEATTIDIFIIDS